MSKKETIEQFLARGGKIQVIPENEDSRQERLKEDRSVKVSTQLDVDNMSLGDGEFFFGESRTRKKPEKNVNDEEFTKMVESANLPPHVMEMLKKATVKDGK